MDLVFKGFSKSCLPVLVIKGRIKRLLESRLELGASVAQAVFGFFFCVNPMEDPYPFRKVFRPLVTCASATAVLQGAQLLGGEGRARLHRH